MVSTLPILAFFVIATVALLIVRIGATALVMTGLSRDVASFQAISSFFGVGFTTSEAEMIVNHPVRRRIVQHLIILGNLGITSGLAAVVVTFVDSAANDERHVGLTALVLLIGFLFAGLAYRFPVVVRPLDALIAYSLDRTGLLRAMDYDTVLRAGSGYAVVEYVMHADHPIAGQTLKEARWGDRGVLVLGIQRDTSHGNEYIGTPAKDTRIESGDLLILYGAEDDIERETAGPNPGTTNQKPSGEPRDDEKS